MDYAKTLSEEFGIRESYCQNIINLLDEGNTIPFIARYRKEMHGSCDDQVLRDIADRLQYLRNLQKRKEEVQNSITEQGKWTEELAVALQNAKTQTEVEDIYRPYKQKRKTRASVAIAKGLQPLADKMFTEFLQSGNVEEIASEFIDAEKEVNSTEEALQGAMDIVAEMISDNADIRKYIREFIFETGEITTEIKPNENYTTYLMYDNFKEKIKTLPSHRILAINRGEKEDCLKVKFNYSQDTILENIKQQYNNKTHIFYDYVNNAIADGLERLVYPSVENEVRNNLTDTANEQAIKMFESNLKPLILQAPLKNKVILGFDPGYRMGCKLAVIDAQGNVLDTGVIYPTPPFSKIEESKQKLLDLINKHKVDVIAIGNGTASKESEIFVANLLKDADHEVSYAMVNEAGASVYSASKLGAEEFPDYDVNLRSAVSIARRLMDPMAELIKIDVKSIGVGQYQHDMPQKRLTEVLGWTVEDCVNSVGVDLNTASPTLLSYVSGLNSGIAKNIEEYRKTHIFKSRKQLLEVKKLGEKAYEQCAGFLRIVGGENIFDNTAVHPESYAVAEKLLKKYNFNISNVMNGEVGALPALVEKDGIDKVATELSTDGPTLIDIAKELTKPGRDIRDELAKPVLRSDILSMEDLKEGMVLDGIVRNVIDFGAFIDIGVHQDGLVHISQICKEYIKHPSEKLTVGDAVKVKVLSVDIEKKRISLTMKDVEE